jgi:hypothetical protein
MKPLSLNLSQVKKIGSDKNSTTFLHPSGHKITIAHNGISALQRKQMEKLPVHKYANGGKSVMDPTPEPSPAPSSDQPESSPSDTTAVDNSAQTSVSPSPGISAADEGATQDQSEPAQNPVQQSLSEQENALNKEKSAYQGLAAGMGQNLNQSRQDMQDQIDALPTQADLFQQYKSKNDTLASAYASKKIDPDKVLNDAGIGGRVAASIALILGGAGGHGNGNIAMDVINNKINNSINAQKNAQDQAANLFKMNQEVYGNNVQAANATREQYLTAFKSKLATAAANTTNLQAQTNAKVAAAQIDQQIGQLHYQRALMTPSQGNLDPSLVINALIPSGPDRDKALEEVKNNQNTVQLAPAIDDAFDKAATEARPLTGGTSSSLQSLNPFNETPNQKRFEGLMNTTVKEKEGTARQAAFESIKKTQRPSTGDSDYDIATKRALKDSYLRANMAAPVSMSHGIDLSKFPSTSLGQGSMAPATNNAINLKVNAFMKANPQVGSAQQALAILQKAGKI